MLPTLFRKFLDSEKSGGLLLIICTAVSLIVANSIWGESYHHFWQIQIGKQAVEYWINDGLMAIFFLLIGLELKREIFIGELSNIKNALLPIFSAIGGMLVPAAIYFMFNAGSETQSGAGIPMATDIAFALGILSLLGNKVPTSLKVFLTALAVIDDLGAILVIAFFYSTGLIWSNLLLALAIWIVLLILNRLKIRYIFIYLVGGIIMWWLMLHSGVHATITGVLLAFAIPFGKGEETSASYKVQHVLHKPVAFIILPLFALSNTAISLEGNLSDVLFKNYSLGIAAGLILGKPLGIFLLTIMAVKLNICTLPSDLNKKQLFGVGCLGGIGFTMSIFITLLAFTDTTIINNAKLVILLASLVSAISGFILLKIFLHKKSQGIITSAL